MTRIETLVDHLAFEIERFEWTAADRLEVSGRWFGVRGRRFVRPTLHLRVDGRRRRLIAVLDHKPWAADTDELWTAAFAWRGDRGAVTAARLEVATDIVLDLPAPAGELPPDPITPRPRPQHEPRRPPSPVASEPPPLPRAAAEPVASPAVDTPPSAEAPDSSSPRDEGAAIAALALERRLVEERAEREQLARELADARQRIDAISSHHESAVARAQEIVDLEGQLAVANARADAAQAHVSRLEHELARVTAAEAAPLTPRTHRRREERERMDVPAVAAVAIALVVVIYIV